MEMKVAFLLVLVCVTASSALQKLIPADKELVYRYEGEIKGVSVHPTPYESNFLLTGRMIVAADANSSIVRMIDLKYRLANGEQRDYRAETVETAVPEDQLKLFQTPFKVVYDENGTTIGLVTDGTVPEYVRNVQRSIASMLQLNANRVLNPDRRAFVATEQSIYGYGTVYYNVIPRGAVTVVQKVRNMTNDVRRADNAYVQSNVVYDDCKRTMDEPTTRDSQTVMEIEERDGAPVIRRIVTSGGIYYQQFEGKSELLYVHAEQTADLIEIRARTDVPTIENQRYDDEIAYYVGDFDDATKAPDMTNGRRQIAMEQTMQEVARMLSEIVAYMTTNQVDTAQPNIKDAQLVNRIMRPLVALDAVTFEKLYAQLAAKPAEEALFRQLLPLVGSRASIVFVRDLIQQKRVKDADAIHMMQEMPLNVKVPNRQLLTDMEAFLDLGNAVSPRVKRYAVLTFATLMFKAEEYACTCGKSSMGGEMVARTQRQRAVQKRSEEMMEQLRKYVDAMMKKLEESTTYEDRMIYVQALGNTRSEYVVDGLTRLFNGAWSTDRNTMALAMWAIYPAIRQQPERMFEFYAPILSDSAYGTELRIVAYYLIMEALPSMATMTTISWMMNNETDHALYQFHYRYLLEMSQTKEPCRQEMRLRATQVLRYTYAPNLYGITGYYRIDYVDAEYNFGGIVSGMAINTNESLVLRAIAGYNIMNRRVNEMAVHVKITGLDGLKSLMLTTKGNQILTIEELWQLVQQIPTNKNVRVEMTTYRQGQVICTIYYDGTNGEALREAFAAVMHEAEEPKTIDYMRVTYAKYGLVILPTEIGFPAMFKIKMPCFFRLEKRFVRTFVNNILTLKTDGKLVMSANAYRGVSFYNPIVDIVQGAARYETFDVAVPLKYDLTYNKLQKTVKMSLLRREKAGEDMIGMRVHSTSMVYVKDDLHNDVLQKSNPNAEKFVVVSRGAAYRKQMPVYNADLDNFGYKMEAVLFDNEKQVTNASMYDALMMRLSRENKNYETPIGRALLSFANICVMLRFQPMPGTGGMMVRFVQNPAKPVTSNELTVRFSRDVKPKHYVLQPEMKLNLKISYSVKNGDAVLKTWDVNAIVDLPVGHEAYTVKAQLTRAVAGQKELRMCLEGYQQYEIDSVTGKFMIGMSQEGDAKCTKDDAIIEVGIVGERSEEQRSKYATYAACQEAAIVNGTALHQYVPCYQAHDTVRKYTYDVKQLRAVPVALETGFQRFVGNLRNHLTASQVHVEEQTEAIEDNRVRVRVNYPTAAVDDRMEIQVDTPKQKFFVFGAPELKWIGLRPENTQFSRMYLFMQRIGLMRECLVKPGTIKVEDKRIDYDMSPEYALFVGDSNETPENGVYVKRMENNRLALKVVRKDHNIEFVPKERDYVITIDGKQVIDGQRSEDWFHYNRLRDTRFMVIVCRHLGVQMYYDGQHVHIEIPRMDVQLYGKCVQQ